MSLDRAITILVLKTASLKIGRTIQQGVRRRAVSGKNGLCLRRSNQQTGAEHSAQAARTIVRDTGNGEVQSPRARRASCPVHRHRPAAESDPGRKLDICAGYNELARRRTSGCRRFSQPERGAADRRRRHRWHCATDVRPLVRLSVSVPVEGMASVSAAAAAVAAFGYGYSSPPEGDVRADAWARKRCAWRRQPLGGRRPRGCCRWCSARLAGVLLHEAVGHRLEGDFNRRGTSGLSRPCGNSLASELCTVVDDGTVANRRGSVAIDDEGTPGNATC